ncbi:MAG: hypothetical protein HDS51_02225 [Barnesiella sp.]|nr:hypothetical protein [Barnesiella sp.]
MKLDVFVRGLAPAVVDNLVPSALHLTLQSRTTRLQMSRTIHRRTLPSERPNQSSYDISHGVA